VTRNALVISEFRKEAEGRSQPLLSMQTLFVDRGKNRGLRKFK
jgi:hypothetical protein